MALMLAWDAYGNQIGQNVTVVGGKLLEENVLRTFVYVFLIMSMKVSQGLVSYGTDEGVGVGRESQFMHFIKQCSLFNALRQTLCSPVQDTQGSCCRFLRPKQEDADGGDACLTPSQRVESATVLVTCLPTLHIRFHGPF